MIELAALTLFLRIASFGYAPVIVTRVVPAGLQTLHDFLSDPRNYAGLAQVRPSSSARVVAVRVSFGPRRVVRYTWILSPDRGATEVDIAAQIETRGILVRLALLLGGRRWLRRRLETMVAALAGRVAPDDRGHRPDLGRAAAGPPPAGCRALRARPRSSRPARRARAVA
jgi:hypothetical protein